MAPPDESAKSAGPTQPAVGKVELTVGKAEPTGGKAEPTGGKAEPTGGKAEPTGGKAEQARALSVRVVPGIARYHRDDCILIRFLALDDLEIMTREAATESGCVPCKACQPDKAAAGVSGG